MTQPHVCIIPDITFFPAREYTFFKVEGVGISVITIFHWLTIHAPTPHTPISLPQKIIAKYLAYS